MSNKGRWIRICNLMMAPNICCSDYDSTSLSKNLRIRIAREGFRTELVTKFSVDANWLSICGVIDLERICSEGKV